MQLLKSILFPCSTSHSFDLRFIRFLIIMILVLNRTHTYYTDAACNPFDKESLLHFATNFTNFLNWSPTADCCSWDGITCDDAGQRVVKLSIPDRRLRGAIPSDSLQNLTSLSVLNLSYTSLTGPLPDGFFASFKTLEIIDLSYSLFSGQFPFDTLPPNLQSLNISRNNFNGTISGSICINSPALETVDLSFNNFFGNIPQGFGTCSNLRVLSLGFNNLEGIIPTDIDGARSLQTLSLPGNHLIGEIGERITNLANLNSLSLFGNRFSGSIPQSIGKLILLERLELHVNFLNGTLPLSLMSCTKLKLLNLRVNSLVGRLADFDFSNFSQLAVIDLGENQFNGVLPRTLFKCKSLTAIRLASNRLEGEISTEILDLPTLSFLSLANNTLNNVTKALRILSNHKKLMTLIISLNFFNEPLPNEGFSGFLDLKIMGLGGCNMTGQIPPWLSSLTNLEVIDLSFNNINGGIPAWLQTLPNLFYLDLSNNDLSGSFPVELTRLVALESQEVLDHVNNSYLELPVFIAPQNFSYLQYNQIANLPPALYLANNHLSGDIPVEIGHMRLIHKLDLSRNNFSGTIPSSISNLTNLEKLDLSLNNLSGEIPTSLKTLSFLSSFSVAYNNLQGSIPTGGQFDSFLDENYEGNPGLCGPPMRYRCGTRSPTTNSSLGHNNDNNTTKLILGLILGVSGGIIGIIIVCIAFCILTKKRRSNSSEILHMGKGSINSRSTVEVPKVGPGLIWFPNHEKDNNHLTITDILNATNNLDQANIIGCGGFGLVYKATLADGTKLAVKRLSGDMDNTAREFGAEVEALSTARHKNLVSLEGYYVDDESKLLIYSYMENGSLEYWLHEETDGASNLDWPTRLKIIQGASCGLAYMHQVCEPHILHRDMKSSNILLDEEFEACLSDFGLSRLIHSYDTHVTTELSGTLGYVPPEYAQASVATFRGDVYSFGVVMLELLTGRRPIEDFRPKESRVLLVWVQKLRLEGKQDAVFDVLLTGKGFEEEMLHVLDVACKCVNENPRERPKIDEVVDWLHKLGP